MLGKYIVRSLNDRLVRAEITETEAYQGFADKASHASRGMTERTKLMFGRPGHVYVYMIYGMYHCLNVVTEKAGYPAAVLIRGARIMNYDPPAGGSIKGKITVIRNSDPVIRLKGPGILCRELRIDKKLNGIDLNTSKELWIESASARKGGRRTGEKINPRIIKKGKRIGVDYAGKWKDKLWRFYI